MIGADYFSNPAERTLDLIDPDDFVMPKKYVCGEKANRDFLRLIILDLT